MPHILLMNNRRLKVFLIPLQIFLAHLPGIENMDLCLSVIDLNRERCCQIRPYLVFDAVSIFGKAIDVG